MANKFKGSLTAVLALATIACAGMGKSGYVAKAAENDVWLPAYMEADAIIDAKEHRWYDTEAGVELDTCELYTKNAAYKTTDWTGRIPEVDAEGNYVSYYTGATMGANTPDEKVGSAVTVEETTTKLKLAQSNGGGRFRYAYPVQLDGLMLTINFQQIEVGNRLRFSFGDNYNTIAHPVLGAANDCTGLAVEMHQESQTWKDFNWFGFNIRSCENFSDSTGATGNGTSDYFCADGTDPGAYTVKMSFDVNDDGSVTLVAQSHRNNPADTTPSKSWTISAEKAENMGMIDDDGNTWIGVTSFADGNNTDTYSRFAIKVEDAKRTAYEETDLAAMESALEAYSATAITDGTVTAENKAEWQAKRQAVVDLKSKIRPSDMYLLDVDAKLAAADEALETKLQVGLEQQIRTQVAEYKNAPLNTLDDVYAALAKKQAIGDYSAFADKDALAAMVAEADAAVLAAADGLLADRMAEVNGFATNGVKSYQQALRAAELKELITDRDLLKDQVLTLENASTYEAAIATMMESKEAFDARLAADKLYFTDQYGKDETSVNDIEFVEKGLQYTFTGGGRQIGLKETIDIEKGARAVFTVDEWAYLSNVYNPNGMSFFISQRANGMRGVGSIAGMLFVYEDGVTLQTFYGKSNNYVDIVNMQPVNEGDASYISLSIKLNKGKSRYEIMVEYLDKDGMMIDFASSYLAYKEADNEIGGVSINEDTYANGAYFYMNSWMVVEGFKNPNGELDETYTPESVFNTVTFKVFGNKVYDEAFVIDYISSISVKEGTMKTEYKVGDAIDLAGATLVITKESGATEEVEIKRSMINGFSTKKEGTITVEISYEGFKTEVTITVAEKDVAGDSGNTDSGDNSGNTNSGDSQDGSSNQSIMSIFSGCTSSVAGMGIVITMMSAAVMVCLKKRED